MPETWSAGAAELVPIGAVVEEVGGAVDVVDVVEVVDVDVELVEVDVGATVVDVVRPAPLPERRLVVLVLLALRGFVVVEL